jgi:hypothetical protein
MWLGRGGPGSSGGALAPSEDEKFLDGVAGSLAWCIAALVPPPAPPRPLPPRLGAVGPPQARETGACGPVPAARRRAVRAATARGGLGRVRRGSAARAREGGRL